MNVMGLFHNVIKDPSYRLLPCLRQDHAESLRICLRVVDLKKLNNFDICTNSRILDEVLNDSKNV